VVVTSLLARLVFLVRERRKIVLTGDFRRFTEPYHQGLVLTSVQDSWSLDLFYHA